MLLSALVGVGLPSTRLQEPEQYRVRALFELHHKMVWRLARRHGCTQQEADDVTQEVFVVAMHRLVDIDAGKEKSFLAGVTVRTVRSVCRKRRWAGHQSLRGDELDPGSLAQESAASLAELDRMLMSLPQAQREVFVLHEIEGLSMAEIAEGLDWRPGTVASRLRRARRALQRQLKRNEVPS